MAQQLDSALAGTPSAFAGNIVFNMTENGTLTFDSEGQPGLANVWTQNAKIFGGNTINVSNNVQRLEVIGADYVDATGALNASIHGYVDGVFRGNSDHDGIAAQVSRLYLLARGNNGEKDGMQYWAMRAQELKASGVENYLEEIAKSFVSQIPQGTALEQIQNMYARFRAEDNPPTQGEINWWHDQYQAWEQELGAVGAQAKMLIGFSENADVKILLDNKVAANIQQALGKKPVVDADGNIQYYEGAHVTVVFTGDENFGTASHNGTRFDFVNPDYSSNVAMGGIGYDEFNGFGPGYYKLEGGAGNDSYYIGPHQNSYFNIYDKQGISYANLEGGSGSVVVNRGSEIRLNEEGRQTVMIDYQGWEPVDPNDNSVPPSLGFFADKPTIITDAHGNIGLVLSGLNNATEISFFVDKSSNVVTFDIGADGKAEGHIYAQTDEYMESFLERFDLDATGDSYTMETTVGEFNYMSLPPVMSPPEPMIMDADEAQLTGVSAYNYDFI